MQRGSVQLLLIFLAVIVIAGGGFYFYQSKKGVKVLQGPKPAPVQQSAFNDYSNPDLGFEFQYPKDLNVKADSEEEFNKRGNGDFRKNFKGYVGYEPAQVSGAAVVLGKDGDYEKNPLSVWVFDNSNSLTIEQWFDKYWYYPYLWGVFDYTSKSHVALDSEATMSGQLAKSKIVVYQPGKPKFVYIAKDNKIYLFRVIGEIGDQILSTFKFLK